MFIVISGVNLVEGGTLKVFRDALITLDKNTSPEDTVYALVHKKELFNDLVFDNITFIEYPDIKKSWLKRLYFELVTCKGLSKKWGADVWLAMHDITPNVAVKKQFVYCHNCSTVYKSNFKDFLYEPKGFLGAKVYNLLYKINIKKNDAIIVQQRWFGEYLKNHVGAERYIVSRPISPVVNDTKPSFSPEHTVNLFYPALPRTFKNFELLLDALSLFNEKSPAHKGKLTLTLTFSEDTNKFSKYIIDKYKHVEGVNFTGLLNFAQVEQAYNQCDVVIFPSLLETWGLPISEAKMHAKPIILADLPYAHETLGNYECAAFIDPYSAEDLANLFVDLMDGKPVFNEVNLKKDDEFYDWDKTIKHLLTTNN